MSDPPREPPQDWEFMRPDPAQPPRGLFTLREVLVALSLGDEWAHSYLETAFGWYFDRTRAFIFGVMAGAIGSASLLFHDGKFSGTLVLVIGSVLVVVLSSLGLHFNHRLSQLHREYLACLALLDRLRGFEAGVASRIRARGEPPSSAYPDLETTRKQPGASLERVSGPHDHQDVGHDQAAWLVAALSPVPTAYYERDPEVRRCVHHLLAALE